MSAVVCWTVDAAGEVHEYCHFETFRARCPHGDVILMQSAYYGRKSLGRCVRTNFGFIGCYTGVLQMLDRRCTGRTSCDVDVIEPNFDDIRPCNVELKSYLQASYVCIAGTLYTQFLLYSCCLVLGLHVTLSFFALIFFFLFMMRLRACMQKPYISISVWCLCVRESDQPAQQTHIEFLIFTVNVIFAVFFLLPVMLLYSCGLCCWCSYAWQIQFIHI